MPHINIHTPSINSYYNIIEKFMRDLELPQEMPTNSAPPSGQDRIREPEIPSSGPVTSFGGRIPKVQGHIFKKKNYYYYYPAKSYFDHFQTLSKLKRSPSAPPIKFYYGDLLTNQRKANRPRKEWFLKFLFYSGLFFIYDHYKVIRGFKKVPPNL